MAYIVADDGSYREIEASPQFSRERVLTVRAIKVVSPRHPLAAHRAPIPMSVLCEHIQLVHADHANVWRAGRFGLLSLRIWRLCDLAAKHHFLRSGFGFGIMPLHMVEADLTSGELVEIKVEDDPPEGHAVVMSAVYLTNSPLGPAGRWFVDRIKQEAASRINGNAATSVDSIGTLPIANRTAAQSRVAGSSLDRPRLYPVSDCGGAIENRDLRKENGQETGRRSAP